MNFWAFTAFLALFSAGSVAIGIAIYSKRDHAVLAWKVLRGHVKHADGRFACNKPHLEGDQAAIKTDELQKLKDANTELIFARGFIASFKDGRTAYAEGVNEILQGKE